MLSLPDEMNRLFFVLNPPIEEDETSIIQFMGASVNEGVSTISREFAFTASRQTSGRILLLDLDYAENPQYESLNERSIQEEFGEIGPATIFKKSRKKSAIDLGAAWIHNPQTPESELSTPIVSFHQLGVSELYVSRVNTDMIDKYGSPRINGLSEYWEALSKYFKMVIINSAPLNKNFEGLAVCKFFDATVMVVSAERTRRPVAKNLRDRILDNEGHIAGVILNRRKMHIPRIVYKLL